MLLQNKKLQLVNVMTLAFVLAASPASSLLALSNETEIADSFSDVVVSGDGSTVAFTTGQGIDESDSNGSLDVYVYDVATDSYEAVSVDSSETLTSGGSFDAVEISHDGRYVVYQSTATDLVSGDTNGDGDVFLRDRTAGTTERVSIDSSEVELNNSSSEPSVSDDGRYVAFSSLATNAVAGDSNGQQDVFLRDRTAATTERVSVTSSEAQLTGGPSYTHGNSLSTDGRFVVFNSEADVASLGDSNGNGDVFLRDTLNDTTTLVSVDSNGDPVSGWSQSGTINRDGTHIAFRTDSALVAADTNGSVDDVYRYIISDGSVALVSVNENGVVGNADSQATGGAMTITESGRFVLFVSKATNLIPGYTPPVGGQDYLYVKDMVTGEIELVTDDVAYTAFEASISDNGGRVAFRGGSINLVLAWPDYATPVVPTNTSLVGGGTTTTDTTPTFTGDCVDGDLITLYVDGQNTGITYTCNSFSLTAPALSLGAHDITFTAARMGNVSAQSAVLSITILGAPDTGLKAQPLGLYVALSAVGAIASSFFARRLIIQKHVQKASSK